MKVSEKIAKHIREIHFGDNWTAVSMKQSLADVNWEQATTKVHSCNTDAEKFALLIEQLPENKFEETFIDEKYGNYYRNIHGIIEHNHYHLGQIVLIKKILGIEGDKK